MNLLEQQLHYPLGDALPAQGDTLAVAPGVRWIRMALPFALNHINLWLLEDEIDGQRGWSVVDCCISADASRAQWEAIFATQLGGLPILRVIVTHMHPDHIGLAAWLCARWNAPLWISATDYFVAEHNIAHSSGNGGPGAAEFFQKHGLSDPQAVDKIRARTGYFSAMVPSLPPSFVRMQDGQTLRIGGRDWRCISGYGHAPEHIALYCAQTRVLIGGDMMLPRISTNVSVFDVEPESNPLQQFLDSIDKFTPLHADTLTLPAHGKPFQGLHTRIQQLHDHHRDHLARVMAFAQQQPCSAADILPVLFTRVLDLHQTTFAMGEAVAHLHKLWVDGYLQRVRGADGVYRFGPTALAYPDSALLEPSEAVPVSA
ncbi:MBL fold metallo-hydrolase [Rhodoferax sp. WC2427]|uniref:MBL fold metallo-hydrolase n=1 Tax=Rhodoferax sp. WC2427 TaxID=3234144 RepID=UPI0034677B03